jgi:signal transduction histidine kinase
LITAVRLITLIASFLPYQFAFPQSKIDNIIVDGHKAELTLKAPFEIKALDNEVIIHLQKPIAASNNTYHYYLQGFDSQWHKSDFNQIRYTNLTGGSYTFLWKINQEKEQSIPVEVEKSLTEEYWFLPVLIFYIVLLLSAAIYFFLLYNLRQKVKIQSIRNRIASDLHDEVGSNLNSIALFTRIAEKKLGAENIEIHALLDKIKSNSEETVSTIRDTVWAINPDNDSSENLFEKMRAMAYEVLSAKDIELNYTNEIIDHKALKMSMEQRRNIYLIFKEAINNIVKHSEATEVNIRISKEKSDIKLDIVDNGKGFDTKENYEGNGLKNYRKRETEGFLNVKLASKIGKGTSIEVLIPEI